MTDTYDPDPPVGLGAVMETELRYIVANSPMPDRDARMRALDRLLERERAREATDEIAAERLREAVFADEDIHLTGLAFSGGGIRSASFGLGVLQSLSRAGLLSRFDYLSGVSGGGYILGWLLAWSYRTKGGLPAVERSLADRTEAREPEPIRHLRRYVMYLAPKSGMLSTDLWGLLAAYLRNLCVTLTFALPLLLIPILVCHLLFAGLRLTVESSPGWWRHLGFAAILVPAAVEILAMRLFARDVRLLPGISEADSSRYLLAIHLSLGTALAGLYLLVPRPDLDWPDAIKLVVAIAMFGFVAWFGEHLKSTRIQGADPEASGRHSAMRMAASALLSGLVFVTIVGGFHAWLGVKPGSPPQEIAWGLPFVALAWSLAVAVPEFVHQFVVSKTMTDADREWTARYSGALLLGSLVWMVATGAVLVVPAWLFALDEPLAPWIGAGVFALVLVVAVVRGKTDLAIGLVASALVIAICLRVFVRVDPFSELAVLGGSVVKTAISVVTLAIIVVVFDRFVNINRFSLHAIYRNRLSRTFLGASRTERPDVAGCAPEESAQFRRRDPGEFQDYDADDNPRLRWLRRREDGPSESGWIPVALFNASLNSTWMITEAGRQQKAFPFFFSQFFCGSPETGYCRSRSYSADEGGVSLATAMATSGAALSSRSGRLDNRLLAFVKTIFNLRLGWWLGNPRDPESRAAAAPKFSMIAFCSELFGTSLRTRDWINLSDGGHFENLAVFELLQRGCSQIVCIDAGADPARDFSDLANLVRTARAELNVDIVLDSPWRIGPPSLGPDGRHCAVFRIDYPNGRHGRLLYIKTAIYDGGAIAPVDAVSYYREHPAFPHESTVDQFFTAAQFESYRRLGEETVRALSGQAAPLASIDEFFAGAERHLAAGG